MKWMQVVHVLKKHMQDGPKVYIYHPYIMILQPFNKHSIEWFSPKCW